MLIPSVITRRWLICSSLSRRVNANSQLAMTEMQKSNKLIKKGEC